MADIRIKDLATTASVTASDDFMAVDGTTNGTRKLSAATPSFATSVTTPSLTSPASTPLTLGTGTSGAAVTVLSADNNVGIGTATPNKKLEVFKDLATNTLGSGEVLRILGDDGNTVGRVTELGFGVGPTGATFASALIGAVNISATGFGTKDLYFATRSATIDVAPTERMRIAATGTVSIASTAAGASNAGALVVAGGISAGQSAQASYFGGAVTAVGDLFGSYSASGAVKLTNSNGIGGIYGYSDAGTTTQWYIASDATNLLIGTGTALPVAIRTNGINALTISTTQAATFAGAVTIGNTVNTVSPTSPNRTVTMVVNGVTLYLAAKTTND